MKLDTAKSFMRVVGTLSGLLGLLLLCIAPPMLYHSVAEQNPLLILFAIIPLALAVYFIYVAYLVWLRFSPLAVRHICGALGFFVLTLVTKLFPPSRDPSAPWPAFAFLGCLVAVYFGYRIASDRLSRSLFPEGGSGPQA